MAKIMDWNSIPSTQFIHIFYITRILIPTKYLS